eukprot:GHVS01054457.1.p1 GENE.GHVS01054457.1~~GHVS01054457.1.p1  ORF type:complete len:214 (-),score=55.20 GHVS01054457.1:135-737(-)
MADIANSQQQFGHLHHNSAATQPSQQQPVAGGGVSRRTTTTSHLPSPFAPTTGYEHNVEHPTRGGSTAGKRKREYGNRVAVCEFMSEVRQQTVADDVVSGGGVGGLEEEQVAVDVDNIDVEGTVGVATSQADPGAAVHTVGAAAVNTVKQLVDEVVKDPVMLQNILGSGEQDMLSWPAPQRTQVLLLQSELKSRGYRVPS